MYVLGIKPLPVYMLHIFLLVSSLSFNFVYGDFDYLKGFLKNTFRHPFLLNLLVVH